MTIRTKRSYELKLGIPIDLSEDFFSPLQEVSDKTIKLEDYYNENSGDSYLITEHDIQYRVKLTGDVAKNTADITVKNLLPETMKYVMDNRGKDLYLELNVGYNGKVKNLFKGTLKTSVKGRSGDDVTLQLKVVDGAVNGLAHTSRAYPKGTSFNKIMNDLRKDLKAPEGRVVALDEKFVTSTPLSIFGNTCDRLDTLTKQFDYQFAIIGGQCNITPVYQMYSEEVAFISPETGLIGDVSALITEGKNGTQVETDTNDLNRIRFICQTDASIKPPSSVYVSDPDNGYDGVYKVEKAIFSCSGIETGSFIVTVDAVKNDTLIPRS